MMSPPHSTEEIFHRLLDETAALLAAPESAGVAIPDDELHREIIVPLLPALLGDAAIRGHWSEQAATGFPARLARHLDGGEPAPRWTPGDFEIHVTASYSAGADARALADTLLSEDSLRDMTAALMNQFLDALWPSLVPIPSSIPEASIDFAPMEIPAQSEQHAPPDRTETESVPVVVLPHAPPLEIEPQKLPPTILPATAEPEHAEETAPAPIPIVHVPSSRALIRALCRNLPAPVVQRTLIAHETRGTSAAILAQRILARTEDCKFVLRDRRRSFGKCRTHRVGGA